MKKTYMKPVVTVTTIMPANMIAVSLGEQIDMKVNEPTEEMDAAVALAIERGDIEIVEEADVWENGLW